MSNEKSYTGGCFCGAVELTVSGEPAAMGYCHCESCRHWSAGPVNAFTLWKPEAVQVTKGEDNIGTYNKTPQSYRKWCKTCGGHIFTEHPTMGLTDVYAAVIPDFPFKPAVHVNYQETVLHIKDGLPKPGTCRRKSAARVKSCPSNGVFAEGKRTLERRHGNH